MTSPRKDPLLSVICSYIFSGVNVCAVGIAIKASYPHYDAFYIIGIEVVFFLMAPITLVDKREENRDARYALYTGIMHFGICVYLSHMWSKWWILIYLLEVVIYIFVGHLVKRYYKGKNSLAYSQNYLPIDIPTSLSPPKLRKYHRPGNQIGCRACGDCFYVLYAPGVTVKPNRV